MLYRGSYVSFIIKISKKFRDHGDHQPAAPLANRVGNHLLVRIILSAPFRAKREVPAKTRPSQLCWKRAAVRHCVKFFISDADKSSKMTTQSISFASAIASASPSSNCNFKAAT